MSLHTWHQQQDYIQCCVPWMVCDMLWLQAPLRHLRQHLIWDNSQHLSACHIQDMMTGIKSREELFPNKSWHCLLRVVIISYCYSMYGNYHSAILWNITGDFATNRTQTNTNTRGELKQQRQEVAYTAGAFWIIVKHWHRLLTGCFFLSWQFLQFCESIFHGFFVGLIAFFCYGVN